MSWESIAILAILLPLHSPTQAGDRTVLKKDEALSAADGLVSDDGGHSLKVVDEGSYVISRVTATKEAVSLWNTGTKGKGKSSLYMQADGNLVLSAGGAPVWASGTNNPGELQKAGGQCFAKLLNHGYLAIYYGTPEGPNRLVWTSPDSYPDDAYYRASLAALDVIYSDKGVAPPGWQTKLFPRSTGTPQISWHHKVGQFRLTFLVASDVDTVFLAIRGTDSDDKANTNMNAEVDMDALKKADKSQVEALMNGIPDLYKHEGFTGVIAHQGWARGANSILSLIESELKKHDSSKKRLIVTGHSMGGAMSYYIPFRLLGDAKLSELIAWDKPHRIYAFAAPRIGAEFKSSFGKSFKAKLTKAALAKSRYFGIYSMENVGTDGVPDSVATIWQDKVNEFLKGWPVKFSRVGVPIDFKTTIKEVDANRALHDSNLYLKGVQQTRHVPLPPPMGWVELFCEGGYVAKFKVTYDGQTTPIETNLSLGMIEFYDVPGTAKTVKVTADAVGGVRIMDRDTDGPPNRQYKVYGATLTPEWKQLDGPHEYTVKVKTKADRTLFKTAGYGTDSNISLTMTGTDGTTKSLKLNHHLDGNIFEQGDFDTFTIFERHVGDLTSITVHHDGKYPGADWTPEYFEITPKRGKTVRFNINRELKEGTYTFKP